ncbi:MAG TPA: hypothetical protein VNA19_09830 [Pyrinomonadaceae bacterium]|jgi:hypothetical protein|nr:hypothetical protein [Pyrinomonadaceae bacterium]
MDLKELATQHEVKIFETSDAAQAEGYTLLEAAKPRNVWNRQSATQAAIYKLVQMKRRGEATDIALVLDPWSVAAAFRKEQT